MDKSRNATQIDEMENTQGGNKTKQIYKSRKERQTEKQNSRRNLQCLKRQNSEKNVSKIVLTKDWINF